MSILFSILLLALGSVFGFACAMAWASAVTIRQAEKEGWGDE